MSKKTENQEIEERFTAWKTQIVGEVVDAQYISECAISALKSPKDYQSAISLCRIAIANFDKVNHLNTILADALAVRGLKETEK